MLYAFVRGYVEPLQEEDAFEEKRMTFAEVPQYIPNDIAVVDVMAKMFVTDIFIRAVRHTAELS